MSSVLPLVVFAAFTGPVSWQFLLAYAVGFGVITATKAYIRGRRV